MGVDKGKDRNLYKIKEELFVPTRRCRKKGDPNFTVPAKIRHTNIGDDITSISSDISISSKRITSELCKKKFP